MAEAGVDYEALLRSMEAGMPQAGTGTAVKVSGNSKPNLDNLEAISAAVTNTIKAENIKKKSLDVAQEALTKQQQDLLQGASAQATVAGEAAGNTEAGKTAAAYQTQQANIVTQNITDLKPQDASSVLAESVRAFTQNMDIATVNTVKAQEATDTTLGSVLRGEHSFGDWAQATFVRDPADYEHAANTAKELARQNAATVTTLQGIYTNQVPINATASTALTAASAADAHTVAAFNYAAKATEFQKQAIDAGTAQIKEAFATSNFNVSSAISQGTLEDKLENSRRSWAAFAAKQDGTDPSYVAIVNGGRRFLGLPELTGEQIKTLHSAPANKAMLDTFAFAGANIYSAAANPSAGVPNALGSPGEALALMEASHGRLPQGMEALQDKLQGFAANTPVNMNGKPVTAAQKAEYVNGSFAQYKASITDIDSDPIFGKPNIQDITGMAALNAPEVAAFNAKVLKPLAASGQYVPIAMVVDAAVKSGLPDNVINMGVGTYAQAAREYIAVTRRHALVGIDAPKGYKAQLSRAAPMASAWGKVSIDLTDEKQRTDYLFARGRVERGEPLQVTKQR